MVEYVFVENNQMVALRLGSTIKHSTVVLFLIVVIRALERIRPFHIVAATRTTYHKSHSPFYTSTRV